MTYLVTGSKGQLGSIFVDILPDDLVIGIDLPEYDITDVESVRKVFDCNSIDYVIHCAAYTDVDGCARNPEQAMLVNAIGTETVANLCAEYDATMILLSTNEVFNGNKLYSYVEWDEPSPINSYGQSKLAAEKITEEVLDNYFIVRTSWMYAIGGVNFLHSILKLARFGKEISVVTDELGAPTYANDLAIAILELIKRAPYGVYHLVNSGNVSRYGLARRLLDLTSYNSVDIQPILLGDYKRDSRPPRKGILANWEAYKYGVVLRPWQTALEEFLTNLRYL
tara:strand:+ start:492 stop:1334 length:843 start_codon:yes stop_codon:yes gene_type:complete